MNKSLKKNENVKMFAKRQFLLICYPKVTNSLILLVTHLRATIVKKRVICQVAVMF